MPWLFCMSAAVRALWVWHNPWWGVGQAPPAIQPLCGGMQNMPYRDCLVVGQVLSASRSDAV